MGHGARRGVQPGQGAAPHQLAVLPAGPGRVDVQGDVDVSSAEWLRSELLRAGRGGVETLDVELDEVTFLGSAGVRVLVELVRSSPQTRLHAASGTVAHQVLKVARLVDEPDDDLLDP